MGVITRSFPPHLYPVEYFLLLHGASPLPPGGEGRPFIPPAELGGILEYFDKQSFKNLVIWIEDLPALLSGFCVTSGAMYHDPSGKSKIVSLGRNDLTG